MEIRARPAPIRYGDPQSPPKPSDLSSSPPSSHACALALQALQDRISILEAENAQLKAALQSSKKSDSDTQRSRLRMLQDTLQKSQATLKEQTAVILRSKEELLRWQKKAEELEHELESLKHTHSLKEEKTQTQSKNAQTRLDAALQRVAWLESELKAAHAVPSSPDTMLSRTCGRPSTPRLSADNDVQRLERELEESRRRESALLSEKNVLDDSLRRSEEARQLLLQHQVKSKAMLEEVAQLNERLVATIHQLKGRSAKDRTPSFQEAI